MKHLVTNLWRVAAAAALCWVSAGHAALIHRYSFTTDASDSVGTANGVARQTITAGVTNGTPVAFSGGSAIFDGAGGYIDLPNRLISTQTNLTLEMWVAWSFSGGNWQRVFDFGMATGGEDTNGSLALGNGLNYLYFAPAAGGTAALPRFTAKDSGGGERPVLNSSASLGFNVDTHVVIVYATNVARLFIDGVQTAIGATQIPLSAIDDRNDFLGRSQYGGDALFKGSLNEFRIFNHALTAQEIKASFQSANPDVLTYAPGAISALTLGVNANMLERQTQTPAISGTFATAGVVALNGADLATFTTSDPNVVAVTAVGDLKAVGPGTATITASLGGMTATASVTVAANPPMLINRYSFSEAQGTTVITDSVGAMNGTLHVGTNAPIQSGTALTLKPVGNIASASYIELPAGVISTRTNATIETWFTWDGPTGDVWTRVFDIGNSGKGHNANASGGGLDSWWFSPVRGGNIYGMDVWNGSTAVSANGPAILPTGKQIHLVAVYAPQNQTTKLYINGRLISTAAAPFALSTLNDANVWLGVSNWDDPPFRGTFNEFRIWEGELSDVDVALSDKAGPDALPVAPGALVSVALSPISSTFIGNLGGAQAQFLGNFQNVAGVDISGLAATTFSSTDTNVFAVTTAGAIAPRNLGSANLIASYKGLSATTSVSILAPIAIRQSGFATNLNSGSATFTAQLLADYTGTNNIDASTFTGVTRSSSDTNVVTISAAGIVTPRLPGTAVLTAVYRWVAGAVTNSLTDNVTVTVVIPPGFVKGALVHRYSFNDAAGGTNFVDSVGTANGIVRNATGTDFPGTGELNLTGTTSTYGDLPNGLISSLTSFTIETWITWNGPVGNAWQRIFDFGRSTTVDANGIPVEDMPGTGYGYTFLTPNSGSTTLRFAIKQGTGAETPQLNAAPLAVGVKTHVAVVYDTVHSVARLYVNGVRVDTGVVTLPLTVVEDINVWLGRSQFNDPFFNGSYDEFRIYNGPLLDADIAATYAAGPNALPTIGPSIAIGKVGSNLEITWPESASGYVLQSAGQLGGVFAPAGVTPTTNAGVVKATIPIATGPTNVFFELKK